MKTKQQEYEENREFLRNVLHDGQTIYGCRSENETAFLGRVYRFFYVSYNREIRDITRTVADLLDERLVTHGVFLEDHEDDHVEKVAERIGKAIDRRLRGESLRYDFD